MTSEALETPAARRLYGQGPIFAVAPMIDWTDRHCRFFHRLLSADALLYTEMVVADAILHGDRERLLGFDAAEQPVALQIGGSDPGKLAEAARIGAGFGYREINLNVGCPSDRVQSGAFGACLMREPELVGRCLAAMREAVDVPVTVKCRIGVDEQDPEPALDALADCSVDAGVSAIWVHARKAWLQGLSPKENRDIPPLDYERVFRLKQRLPSMFVGLNGGLATVADAASHLGRVDGVMMGRGIYADPAGLAEVGPFVHGRAREAIDYPAVLGSMVDYSGRHVARGGRLGQVTRHMLGLFTGLPGARRWRQVLSEGAPRADARPELILEAFAEVELPTGQSAAA
ncbi:tRNA dihydrouridine(20/20a) synthase DusA [Aureimonas pseudogalii]|uniref:tRNA-dihydrouridine(20/20a) synthase n=1 Tax=Aureimonas pseudogalii TaxID=1744844 RepID=A0A7W6EC93_9HYPH|nr:tRNA dihydrouridine(20/20a) synthase DusA [Aureimonas pseudogalii]MBB3998199.1 tRNA-dihydrouridine synthase A [Aureimonas pseudogalii]